VNSQGRDGPPGRPDRRKRLARNLEIEWHHRTRASERRPGGPSLPLHTKQKRPGEPPRPRAWRP